jgi:hypothetical protein
LRPLRRFAAWSLNFQGDFKMLKIVAIVSILTIASFISPSPVNAAQSKGGAKADQSAMAPTDISAHRRRHITWRGPVLYFRGQPWGPGYWSGWAPFGGPAGFYSSWRPYHHYSYGPDTRYAYGGPFGPWW